MRGHRQESGDRDGGFHYSLVSEPSAFTSTSDFLPALLVWPEGKARIRIIMTSEHTHEQLDRALDILVTTAKKMSIL